MSEFTEKQILGGYAFKEYEKELQAHNRKRYKEIAQIADEIELTKRPAYGKGVFSGRLLTDRAKALKPSDLAIFADHGNLCFGGSCQKSGDRFSGCYYTD